MAGDPRSARMTALADIQLGRAKARNATASAIATMLADVAAANAVADATAGKARAKVTAVDAAAAEARRAAEESAASEQPTDITQFFPSVPVGAAQPGGGGPPTSFMELVSRSGGSPNALANAAVAPARQAAGTLPSAQPSAPQQYAQAGGGGGQSVNVGGQQFTAPETMTTTRETTAPFQFGPGLFVPATTREVVTEPNVLRAGDILAARQQQQRNLHETLFRLGREGIIGPDAVTAATALDRGDYVTYGRVLADKPLLSARVQEQRMQVQDAQIQAYRAQTAQAIEATRGSRLLNDALVQQLSATAEGTGQLSDNDIFGIPAPSAQSLGLATSVRGALAGGGGGLTANQFTDAMRSIKVDKDGNLDAGSASALMALQGDGIQKRIAVFAAPKRGAVTDLMRSFGFAADEVSHIQMVPMDEVIGTTIKAAQGDPVQIQRVLDWGLFESDGQGGINTVKKGPNAMLSQGIERKLQLILDARGYGGDPQVAPPEVPTPDELEAEAAAAGVPGIPGYENPLPGMVEAGRTMGRGVQRLILGREPKKKEVRPPVRPLVTPTGPRR